MPAPIMTAAQAVIKYGSKYSIRKVGSMVMLKNSDGKTVQVKPSHNVYHRGNGKFGLYTPEADMRRRSSGSKGKQVVGSGKYRHTSDFKGNPVKKGVPQNKIKTTAGTNGWAVSSGVKRSLDDSDIKSLKKAYKFYVEQFYNSADKVQKIGMWLSYNKYRKDETKWKASYKKQNAMEQKTLKDALKYKKMVNSALLKPPNHSDVMKDINDMIKSIS